jgi:putative copper export protein/methionine-rich copper-binding protein CopC
MIRTTQQALCAGFAALAVCAGLLLAVSAGPAAASPGLLSSYPAANQVLGHSPPSVILQPTAPIDPTESRTTVYDANHEAVADGRLATAMPRLGTGVYTVVWSLGHPGPTARTGSYAFAVAPAGAPPTLVAQTAPPPALTPTSQAIPRWLAFVFVMAMIGALGLRVIVTRPSVRRLPADEQPAVGRAADRTLLILAAAAVVCFIPATLAQMIYESADEGSTLGFWALASPSLTGRYLWNTPDGNLWLIRFALTLLAAAVLVPAAIRALRGGWQHDDRRVTRVMLIGLAAGTGELVARVIPTKPPPSWPRQIFTSVLDWGHMFSASIWIGGLVGLGVLAATIRVPTAERRRFFPIALRHFSVVATTCVGAMILTGLWTYWIHVGPPRLLFHTLYGETLLVKIALVVLLVGLGAVNQLVLLPRINAVREAGDGTIVVALRRFRGVVAAEAVVGLLILLVVPFLSGSARNQAFQRQAADLTQTANVGGRAVSVRPSGAQPGITDYDVTVPHATGAVTVAFSSDTLGIPATDVLATAVGGDHYRVSGLYTPVVGPWNVRVQAAGEPPATFTLGVTADPPKPAKAPPPPIRTSTWLWGIVEFLTVATALGGARLASRRLTRRRAGQLAPAAA